MNRLVKFTEKALPVLQVILMAWIITVLVLNFNTMPRFVILVQGLLIGGVFTQFFYSRMLNGYKKIVDDYEKIAESSFEMVDDLMKEIAKSEARVRAQSKN